MKKTALFILGLIAIPAVMMAQSWKPLQAEAKAEKAFADSPAVVLLDSTAVNVSELGSGTFVIRRVIRSITRRVRLPTVSSSMTTIL